MMWLMHDMWDRVWQVSTLWIVLGLILILAVILAVWVDKANGRFK